MLVPTLLSALPVRLSALLSLDRSERGFVVESSPYFSAVHEARCTASNIRTPHLQLLSLWGLGGRRTRFRSSSALLVPSLLSVAPNLTVGLSLVGPFGKEFRLGPFTFSFCGTLGSLHGFKHKNPTLAAV